MFAKRSNAAVSLRSTPLATPPANTHYRFKLMLFQIFMLDTATERRTLLAIEKHFKRGKSFRQKRTIQTSTQKNLWSKQERHRQLYSCCVRRSKQVHDRAIPRSACCEKNRKSEYRWPSKFDKGESPAVMQVTALEPLLAAMFSS